MTYWNAQPGDTRKRIPPIGRYMHRVESLREETDEELMVQVANGDAGAFRLLMSRHLKGVASMSRRMLGDTFEAEDIAQEVFLKLWKQAQTFNPDKARLTTWLYRIAGNLCIDRLRKRKSQGIPEPIETAETIGRPATQMDVIEKKQLAIKIDRTLQELPERQRYALVLCHYQGLKMKEAALIMEISEDALESLLARARRSLKKKLANEWKALMPEGSGLH